MYNYTIPRGPIAAMYASPGPCYGLPTLVGQPQHDPRSVKNRGPAYSFGTKHGKLKDDCSPGPRYQPEAKIYKDGKDGTPHYSLYSRNKDMQGFKTPGPGTHSPEKVGQQAYLRHPAYSFGLRGRQRTTDNIPGPNCYNLDSMLGKTVRSGKNQLPQYTMRPKTVVGAFYEDLAKTPGPANYSTTNPDVNRRKMPLYSMTSRNNMPGDTTQKPGPGAHSPERVYVNKKQAQVCGFGIKHSQYICPLITDPLS